MRRLPYLLLLLLVTVTAQAQNLVANGSFEQYSTCPTGISQANNCIGWRQYTTASTDYFHNCNATMIPVVLQGWQNPADGDAFMGFYTFASASTSIYKEYIAASIPALAPGNLYEVSISISLANNSTHGTNDIAVYFYDGGPATASTGTVLSVTPQVSYTSYGPVTDTQNWVRLTQTFLADSAYDNIVIGGFKGWGSIGPGDTTRIKPGGPLSYYYLDSVVIKLVDTLSFVYNDTLLCVGDSIIAPFTATGGTFAPTNVFTLQLSDANGSFASPITIASVTGTTSSVLKGIVPTGIPGGSGYKLRIVASNPSKVVTNPKNIAIGVSKPAKPVAVGNSPVCGGSILFLSATTTTSGVTWQWTGPGFTSALQNPVVTNFAPANAGNYIVTAFNLGCESKDTIAITYQAPVTPVTATNSGPVCEGSGFTLSTTASTTGATYSWTGPNGFSSAQQNPAISNSTVNMSGDYVITATLNGCSAKDTTTVLVKPVPVATAANNGPICEGEALILTATSTLINSTFSWAGPSFSSNSQSPSIPGATPANTGNYTVTVTKDGCNSLPVTTAVVINPIAAVNATNTSPVCEGTGFSLSTTASSPGATYSWTGPNSYTSGVQNPAIVSSTLSMSGDYIVTASLNGCTTKDTTTVLIKPVPVATASNSGPNCEGGTLNLTGTSNIGSSTFSWFGPSGFSSNLQSPSIPSATAANTGVYTVTATKDGCTSQPANTPAIVHPIPATPVANANSIMCDGSPLNLSTATVSNATYFWTGPNGFTSSLQNPSINPATFIHAGFYSVRISVNGCLSAKDSVNVKVNIIPKIGGYASPNDTICEGTLTSYVAIHSNGGANPVFQWYKNYSPIPGANGLIHSTSNLKTGDVFYCTMYSVGVCTDPVTVSTDTISMVVLPIVTQPSATISSVPAIPQPDKLVSFTAHVKNGGPDPKYQWQLNGTNQIGATYATWSAYTLKPFDKVNVIITSNDPCAINKTASSDTITVGFPTAITNIVANNSLAVYPNPNDGNFRITATNILGTVVKLELINAVGQLVYKSAVNPVNKQLDTDVSVNGIASGIYLLKLDDSGTVSTVKLTIR